MDNLSFVHEKKILRHLGKGNSGDEREKGDKEDEEKEGGGS